MLKVENLRINYGPIQAIQDISFEVREQEIVTLIGSNGAGKSTTLKAISNLVSPSSGRISFEGTDITGLEPGQIVRQGICHIPEGRLIFPYLTVEENLIMGDYGNTRHRPNRVRENLDQVYQLFPRLRERRKQNGGSLSGGEQQMLAIGRGLMLEPKLVMLDEPSLGLAPVIVEQIFELILTIRNWGKTILLIEQNANLALEIADRGLVMETGRIVLAGPTKNLINNPQVAQVYLGI